MLPQTRLTDVQRGLVQAMLDDEIPFIVIGGHAMRANGAVDRQTDDLDVLLNLDQRSAMALAQYFKSINPMVNVHDLSNRMIESHRGQIPFGTYGVHHADLLMSVKGIPFSEIVARPVSFGDQVLPVALRLDVIRLKEIAIASADPEEVKQKHRDDIELLKKLELMERQERG